MSPCAVSTLTHHLGWGCSPRYTPDIWLFLLYQPTFSRGAECMLCLTPSLPLAVLFQFSHPTLLFQCDLTLTKECRGDRFFPWPPPSHDMRWWTAGPGDIHLTHTPPLLPYAGSSIASSFYCLSLIHHAKKWNLLLMCRSGFYKKTPNCTSTLRTRNISLCQWDGKAWWHMIMFPH